MIICPECGNKIKPPEVWPLRCICGARFGSDLVVMETNRPIVKSADHHAMPFGDWTEQMLSSIGVTKERYVEAKKLFGLPPTCGCLKRKEWLNNVSHWWRMK